MTPNEIPSSGYLYVPNLYPVRDQVEIFERRFIIDFDHDSEIFGNTTQPTEVGHVLENGLSTFFDSHQSGILITGSKAFALMKSTNRFFLFDSHSCDANGNPSMNGRSCLTTTTSIPNLLRVIKQAIGSVKNAAYSIDCLDVIEV